MKYAIVTLAGSLVLGISSLAQAMKTQFGNTRNDFTAIGFILLAIGLIGVCNRDFAEWRKNRDK